MTVLGRDVWRARQAAHQARVDAWTAPVLDRARRGEAHPVEDFLFTYYDHRPGRLRRWSPGGGVVLAGAVPADLGAHGVDVPGGAVLGPPPGRVVAHAVRLAELLSRTAARPAYLGCFGLHEWAMVHGQTAEQVRHPAWPLRLGPEGTARLVEALPVRCSHYDAFRFFPPSSRPLNVLQPTRASQVELEQPGCLHATMDLYRAAYTLSPWVPAELVGDAFALAREVRVLDMRASPYDLRGLGLEPVRIETPEGRAAYAAAQRDYAERAAPLRARLVELAAALAADGQAVRRSRDATAPSA